MREARGIVGNKQHHAALPAQRHTRQSDASLSRRAEEEGTGWVTAEQSDSARQLENVSTQSARRKTQKLERRRGRGSKTTTDHRWAQKHRRQQRSTKHTRYSLKGSNKMTIVASRLARGVWVFRCHNSIKKIFLGWTIVDSKIYTVNSTWITKQITALRQIFMAWFLNMKAMLTDSNYANTQC